MAEEFHSTAGGGACSTMSCCWWNTNCAAFDAAPQPFLCSTPTAVRDLGHIDRLIINGNQPFLPIESSVDSSSVNPLKEAFLPGFFEPAEPAEALNYDHDGHHQYGSGLQYSNSPWAKFINPDQFLDQAPSVIPNLQQASFCNNSSTSTPPHDQLWEPSCPSLTPTLQSKCMTNKDHIGSEPPSKKPRIGMLSPLPSFKVRKEKLGDRVTALQQLVSPFGKTDTASVLHEAIEYIKFLHDQVGQVLISPNLQQSLDPRKNNYVSTDDGEVTINTDLSSRGLCLVPISSTFAFASECSMDFWAPNYGGSYI